MLVSIDDQLSAIGKVLITGMGGLGKSELCRVYYWKREPSSPHIGWINYTGDLRVDFASQITISSEYNLNDNIDEKFLRICRYLNELPSESLLIIDNLDNPEDEMLGQLAALSIQVLVTARGKLKWFEDKQKSLDFLELEDCRKLFCYYYKRPVEDTELLDKIINRAGRHTLMLEMMAKTAGYFSAKELLEELEQQGIDLSEAIPAEIDVNWSKTPGLLYEHLCKLFDMTKLCDDEKQLLHDLSLFAPVPLEEEFVKELIGRKGCIKVQKLIDKGWLERDTEQLYVWMHPILREVVQKTNTYEMERCQSIIESFTKKLFYKNRENPLLKTKYIIHGYSILHIFNDSPTELIGTLLHNISCILGCSGRYEEALRCEEKAIIINEKILGADHPGIVVYYSNLSYVYRLMGKYDEALAWQEKVIAINEKNLEVNDLNLMVCYDNFSQVYHAMGRYKEALEWQKKTIALSTNVLDAENPSLAAIYNNFSVIYQAMGKYEEALTWQKKAISINEKVLEVDHPNISALYNNRSSIYQAMGQYDEALIWQKKVITINEKVLNPDHPSLAVYYSNLSGVYEAMGKYDEALTWQKKAITINQKVLEADHPLLATFYSHLSGIYRDMNRIEEALEWQEKAIIIREKVLEANHPDIAASYNNLSLIYQAMEKYEEALTWQKKAMEISEKVLGIDHPHLAVSCNNLRLIYFDMGRYNEAIAWQKKAIFIRKKVLKPDHPEIAESYNNFSVVYHSMGK